MAQFVKATSIRNHNSRKRQISRGSKNVAQGITKTLGKRKKWMTYVSAAVSLLIIFAVLFDQLWMRNERYIMTQITVVHSGQSVPYAQVPDQEIVKSLQGKHYYLTRSRGVLRQLRNQYPIVGALELSPGARGYDLTIVYRPVQITLLFSGQYYGLLDQELYTMTSGGSGVALQIPTYFTGMTLSGLFYAVPADQLAKQYQVMIQGLTDQDIQAARYHVSAKQVQINTPRQELYFDVSGNIYEQLKVYRQLLTQTGAVVNQRVVDVGSLKDGAVVYP